MQTLRETEIKPTAKSLITLVAHNSLRDRCCSPHNRDIRSDQQWTPEPSVFSLTRINQKLGLVYLCMPGWKLRWVVEELIHEWITHSILRTARSIAGLAAATASAGWFINPGHTSDRALTPGKHCKAQTVWINARDIRITRAVTISGPPNLVSCSQR